MRRGWALAGMANIIGVKPGKQHRLAILLCAVAVALPGIGRASSRSQLGQSVRVAQSDAPAPSQRPSRPALGAIGGTQPTTRPADAPPQSTLQPTAAPPVDRNAAYFNRPGAIPRTSFQPINNNAPTVKDETPPLPPAQRANPVLVAPRAATATPQPVTPAALQPAQKGAQLIRPQPLGQPRVLRERSRLVPSIIVPSTKVFPAHGPQAVRPLPSASAGAAQPRPPLQPLVSAPASASAVLPGTLTPSTALSPFAPPSQPTQAQPPVRDIPNSRTPPTELGALPTVRPRPHSIMEGRKTPQKQCPAGLAIC